jgi:hypothetical protein
MLCPGLATFKKHVLIARKQCSLVCLPLGSMARKLCVHAGLPTIAEHVKLVHVCFLV